MIRRAISGIVLAAMLISLMIPAFLIQPVKATVWTVNDDGGADFTRIQDAINAASDGDSINVLSGTYNELLTIDKDLHISGENRETTIIDGSGLGGTYDDLVTIAASGVQIRRLTIRNLDSSLGSAVYISAGCSANALIDLNILNIERYAIFLAGSDYNVIGSNTISGRSFGIELSDSHHNCIENNEITDLDDYGIIITDSSHNVIRGNTVNNNYIGLSLDASSSNTVSDNELIGNQWDGVQLLEGCIDNHVERNIIRDCQQDDGIDIHTNSDHNYITLNLITGNTGSGISLTTSNFNTIWGNILQENHQYGIYVDTSSDNTISNNDFVDNTFNSIISNAHVLDAESSNQWNDNIRGNYWSDYGGEDLDNNGIGDTPYTIYIPNNIDNYPIMSFFIIGNINHDHVVDIFDAVLLASAFGTHYTPPPYHPADLNYDGVIDIYDAVILAANFGMGYP